jgi:hypothetical protein
MKSEQNVTRMTIDYPDFSPLFAEVDSTIDKIKLELDVNKYELETTKLEKENRFFSLPLWFSGIALLISIITPVITFWLQDKSAKKQIILIQPTQTAKSGATTSLTSGKDSSALATRDTSK